MGELEFHVIDFFLSPFFLLKWENFVENLSRAAKNDIFREALWDEWKRILEKKIYLSIKIERLILFFFYIETELQIREDYGIFMGFDWFKGIIIDALSVKENGTYVCPEMDTSSDSWGIVEIGNACQAICLVSTWHKARAHGTDK